MKKEDCLRKIEKDDFMFGEEDLISVLGKEKVEKIKKQTPILYCILRTCPTSLTGEAID